MYVFVSAIFLLLIVPHSSGESYLCTKEFCKNYQDNEGCPEDTIKGDEKIQLLSVTPCNCCDFFIKKLKLGEECQIGSPSSPPPDSVCGDRLFCTKPSKDDQLPTCQPMITDCTTAQTAWDEKRESGDLGNMEVRPECDSDGNYSPFNCIPGQTCYCQNKKGERIFGDFLFGPKNQLEMKCECARLADTAQKLLGNTQRFQIPTIRCLANGNYDPLQCFENNCLCTEILTGIPSEADWFANPVNISEIGQYSMDCYNTDIHTPNKFSKKCQDQYELDKAEVLEIEAQGFKVLSKKITECQPDGQYDKIQETFTDKFCVDPDGKLIRNFTVASKSELAKTMNCNCARALLLLETSESHDKPVCCSNGNYAQMQCRLNECRCVDENGNQVEKQVYKHEAMKLSCYSEKPICTSPASE